MLLIWKFLRAYLVRFAEILQIEQVNQKLLKMFRFEFNFGRNFSGHCILNLKPWKCFFESKIHFWFTFQRIFRLLFQKWNFWGHARSHDVIPGQILPSSPPRKWLKWVRSGLNPISSSALENKSFWKIKMPAR